MHFDFYFDCIQLKEESVAWTDWINVIIAIINVSLVVYIFWHQRKKDADERKFQIDSKSKEFKHNWFKEIFVLPKIEIINNHFIQIEKITEKLKPNGLTVRQRNNMDKLLKAEFRNFSKEFVELLYAVSSQFAKKLQDVSDLCLDKVQTQVHSPTKALSVDAKYNELVLDEIRTYRNEIISNIYTFEDLN
ncbi:MAG: hypothetical protein V4565_14645 [Bacteroidota bacterium]